MKIWLLMVTIFQQRDREVHPADGWTQSLQFASDSHRDAPGNKGSRFVPWNLDRKSKFGCLSVRNTLVT